MITVSGKELCLWRREAIAKAIAAKVSAKEVDWLLQEVTTLDSLTLRLESFENYPTIALTYPLPELTQLWQQRLTNYLPVQYLVGKTTWRNWQFHVSPAVLIPRPETELVIEIVRQLNLPQQSVNHWVDLGTGSGAIAIALAASFPQAIIHAVDISDDALKIARKNAKIADNEQQINFYQGSWWNPLQHLQGKVTGMISNPPYIPSAELPRLQPEVFHHEPHIALDGGVDGLDAIRHLATVSPQYLHSGGVWLIEMMAGQAKEVVTMLSNQGDYYNIKAIADLSGIDRFVLAYRK
ncbi:Release factor glutamine methyltransferase [Hyella patelloides LEGE 07179]|uniref:Release factor glutamine methyltransferase n=1 Tax=Hyella patelloides LEGE 07179 TaxID=945734 RepID=A0A563VQ26_9CYAN|nr:peptide chain release factor N(5)-glutamine methyltransferase [Hyella patelloides]VEP13533.1 Release factor glutamine methyltransferase [Hyella patelloides LEGE 07179]